MTLFIKKLNDDAQLPTYGSEGAACFDIYADKDTGWNGIYGETGEQIGWEAVISTGLSFEISKGYRMDIYPRSGWGFKHNIQLANGTGKIDSDYRGEVKVKLIAFCKQEELPSIEKGSRVAQAEINTVIQTIFKEVDTLSNTDRGEGGFGSTGTK